MNFLRNLMLLAVFVCNAGLAHAATITPDISGQAGVVTELLPPAGTAIFPDSITVFGGGDAEGTLSAPNGLFNVFDGSISTNFDSDPLDIAFANPIYALQFNVGITDVDGIFLSGTLSLSVSGEVFDYVLGGGGYEAVAIASNVGFQSASLSIFDFDTNASSIAFIDANAISVSTIAPIPLPAGGLLMLTGLLFVIGARRRVSET
ncbi:hypothetical protein Q4555_16220 [Octadecabacter sp. 1_MG-2023]|uniref:hypothetical protein n=1 Tax=unclassified Octadecabacter TaxID=196158 RepID=UPI001C09951E|nr:MULTISPECIES: hypothetical protein [unclassified Octadecabacter]MBU2991589.1 hypothetical protein [Octadecabacter sp. B2R22]MDO6736221.1 hypothetical protein [Octadecabacter sp. 1_MG-2023]